MTLIKLHRQINDLFQHCEIKCNGFCCGWDAFDFSEHWVRRWCEFRDRIELKGAIAELSALDRDLANELDETDVEVTNFLRTSVRLIREQVLTIASTIRNFEEPSGL